METHIPQYISVSQPMSVREANWFLSWKLMQSMMMKLTLMLTQFELVEMLLVVSLVLLVADCFPTNKMMIYADDLVHVTTFSYLNCNFLINCI